MAGLPGSRSLEILERIYQNEEREVLRLRDAADGHTEVLKLARPGASEATRAGLAREFLLLERLRHPHWVHPLGFVHLPDGAAGYRMEDISGGPPGGIHSPGWDPRSLDAIQQILGALAVLHALGLAHLDLKPAQILHHERRGACLIDPGYAAPLAEPIVPRGTWGFISPEILSHSTWDRRADLYALGATIVQIWTGENPLGTGEIADQIRQLQQRPRLRLRNRVPEIPEGCDRIVESLLDPDPAGRPACALDVWRSLHLVAGFRERYLERAVLPAPLDLPFVPDVAVEEQWRADLAQGRAWALEGPEGSGRRRLLERLQALAAVEGIDAIVEQDGRLLASDGRLLARIGKGRAGEWTVERGAIGEEGARAALEAYGLEPEGGEADWTPLLLRLRIEERRGGEEAVRAARRQRRSLAAASGASLSGGARRALASALAARRVEEMPSAPAESGERAELERASLIRSASGDGRVRPGDPPWDTESLRVVAGEEEVRAAHRDLAVRAGADVVSEAEHALAGRDRFTLQRTLREAVDRLCAAGRLGEAVQLLAGAREWLGEHAAADLLEKEALLAIDLADPALCFPLLAREASRLRPDVRRLLEARLAARAARWEDVLEILAEVAEQDPPVQQRAEGMRISGLLQTGRSAEAFAAGARLLGAWRSGEPLHLILATASQLCTFATQAGHEEIVEKASVICREAIHSPDPAARTRGSAALGSVAFQRGNFEEACRCFELCLQAADEAGDAMNQQLARVNLGGVWYEQGKLARSAEVLRAACSESSAPVGASIRHHNLAAVLASQGEWLEAIEQARQAIALAPHADAVASSQVLEASILISAGLLDAARSALDSTAGWIDGATSGLDRPFALRQRAILLRLEGDPEKALQTLTESIEAAEALEAWDEKARGLLDRAAIASVLGRIDQARADAGEAASLMTSQQRGELSLILSFVGAMILAAEGRFADQAALEKLTKAARIANESGLGSWPWRIHAANAALQQRAGDHYAVVDSILHARDALREHLDRVGSDPLRESFILLPEPRRFLAWCNGEALPAGSLPRAATDLEVFLP